MATIILKTLVDIYKPITFEGEQPKLIKRNVEYLKTFESHNITVENYIKPNGTISKIWSNVKEGDNYYRVKHSFDYIYKLISPIKIKGFKINNKNEKHRNSNNIRKTR